MARSLQAPEQPRELPLEDTLREIMLCDRRAGKERREVRVAESCRGRLLTQRVQGALQAGKVGQRGGGGEVGRRQREGRSVLEPGPGGGYAAERGNDNVTNVRATRTWLGPRAPTLRPGKGGINNNNNSN